MFMGNPTVHIALVTVLGGLILVMMSAHSPGGGKPAPGAADTAAGDLRFESLGNDIGDLRRELM